MTTATKFKEDDFVRELALDELNRLNVNIQEFIIKNKTEEKVNKTKKQLLQEDKKDG